MNKNDLEFDTVLVDQNNLQSLISFEVNRLTSRFQKTDVGQFIRSCQFELNFPTTIGKSKWIVLLFLNGQYDAGRPDDMINIYLKLVQCEHQSAEFKFDVTFQLGGEYFKTTKKCDQRLYFANAKTRWIGMKMVKVVEMKYIQNDILELSVQLDEHLPFATDNYKLATDSCVKSENKMINSPYVSTAEEAYNNNFWSNKEQHEKTEKMAIDTPEHAEHSTGHVSFAEAAYNFWVEKEAIGTPEHSTRHLASARATYNSNNNSSFKKEPFVTTERMSVDSPDYEHSKKYEPLSAALCNNNSPKYATLIPAINNFRNKLQNATTMQTASSSGPGDSAYCRNLIRDSNLNHVHNEFSDEEGDPTKSTVPNRFFDVLKNFFGAPKPKSYEK